MQEIIFSFKSFYFEELSQKTIFLLVMGCPKKLKIKIKIFFLGDTPSN
jgi:hypothetical protein